MCWFPASETMDVHLTGMKLGHPDEVENELKDIKAAIPAEELRSCFPSLIQVIIACLYCITLISSNAPGSENDDSDSDIKHLLCYQVELKVSKHRECILKMVLPEDYPNTTLHIQLISKVLHPVRGPTGKHKSLSGIHYYPT